MTVSPRSRSQAATGGWPIAGAEHPWAGRDRFPGDRDALGQIPLPLGAPWAAAETNVWQGLPTGRHPSADCP